MRDREARRSRLTLTVERGDYQFGAVRSRGRVPTPAAHSRVSIASTSAEAERIVIGWPARDGVFRGVEF